MEIDLCIAVNWEYDHEAARDLDKVAGGLGLRCYIVHDALLASFREQIERSEARVGLLFDRASDTDEGYLALAQALKQRGTVVINDPAAARHALDKGCVIEELRNMGLDLPRTLVLPPWQQESGRVVDFDALVRALGLPLVAKPARGYGGEGVSVDVRSAEQLTGIRQTVPDDFYLLQEKIVPALLGQHKAWFRTFWIGSPTRCAIIPTLWDYETRRYYAADLVEAETSRCLTLIAERIHQVTGLTFFTFEVALTPAGQYVVIDPNNDQPDLRSQEQFDDGVPAEIRWSVLTRLAEYCKQTADNRQQIADSR